MSSANHSGELLHLDIFPHHCSFCFILLVQGDRDGLAVNGPSTDTLHKLFKGIAIETKPRLKHAALHLAHCMASRRGDSEPDELFESTDVCRQVGVEVIAVESRPKCRIRRGTEEVIENVEFLHGLGQRSIAGSWESRRCR